MRSPLALSSLSLSFSVAPFHLGLQCNNYSLSSAHSPTYNRSFSLSISHAPSLLHHTTPPAPSISVTLLDPLTGQDLPSSLTDVPALPFFRQAYKRLIHRKPKKTSLALSVAAVPSLASFIFSSLQNNIQSSVFSGFVSRFILSLPPEHYAPIIDDCLLEAAAFDSRKARIVHAVLNSTTLRTPSQTLLSFLSIYVYCVVFFCYSSFSKRLAEPRPTTCTQSQLGGPISLDV